MKYNRDEAVGYDRNGEETTKSSNKMKQRVIQSESGSSNMERSKLFDSNNNGQSDTSVMRDQLRSHTESNSNSSEIEDWQILEVDEQQVLVESMNSKHKINNNNNDYTSSQQKQLHRQEIKNSRKYIEIDPSLRQKNYSPFLIYICTAIYSLLPLASVLTTFILIALIFTRYFPITLLYFTYTFLKRNTFNQGGQRISFIYNSKFWSYIAAYFPIKLRYSANFKLDPSENYILHYGPHGISAFGAVTAFATNALNLSQLFPGIKARFMVHETSFITPIMKETFAFRGDCSVNSKSIDHMLTKESTGNLLTIVVGGLAEADLSDMDTLKIVVASRKGFIKKALVHGTNIIPCIAFGENSVFNKVNLTPGSILHKLESFWYDNFKFKHPIYYGRSIVSDKLNGVMPYKRPITVVMGDPLIVNKIENPTQQDIDKLHDQYLKQLTSVYNDNCDLCKIYDKKLELL